MDRTAPLSHRPTGPFGKSQTPQNGVCASHPCDLSEIAFLTLRLFLRRRPTEKPQTLKNRSALPAFVLERTRAPLPHRPTGPFGKSQTPQNGVCASHEFPVSSFQFPLSSFHFPNQTCLLSTPSSTINNPLQVCIPWQGAFLCIVEIAQGSWRTTRNTA